MCSRVGQDDRAMLLRSPFLVHAPLQATTPATAMTTMMLTTTAITATTMTTTTITTTTSATSARSKGESTHVCQATLVAFSAAMITRLAPVGVCCSAQSRSTSANTSHGRSAHVVGLLPRSHFREDALDSQVVRHGPSGAPVVAGHCGALAPREQEHGDQGGAASLSAAPISIGGAYAPGPCVPAGRLRVPRAR